MKWIKCSEQPPPRGAVLRDVKYKQVIKNYDVKNTRVVEYDECSEVIERYTFDFVEWLDESPLVGIYLHCECGKETKIIAQNVEVDVAQSVTYSCECGRNYQ